MAATIKSSVMMNNANNYAMTIPASTVAGDLLIFLTGNYSSYAVPGGGNWTNIFQGFSNSGGLNFYMGAYRRFATAGDASTGISVSGLQPYNSGILLVISGADPTTPVNGFNWNPNYGNQSFASGAVTTTKGTLNIGFVGMMTGGGAVPTYTTAWGTSVIYGPGNSYGANQVFQNYTAAAGTVPSFTGNSSAPGGDCIASIISIADGNATPTVTNQQPNIKAIDPRIPQTFTWQYNDSEGNPQTNYQIQYRERGTTTWTQTAVTTSAAATHTFAANTFTLGKEYEWQTRVSDAVAGQGTWSLSAYFTAAVDMWKYSTQVTSSTSSGTIPNADIYFNDFETNITGWESNPVFGTYATATMARTLTRAKTGSYALEVTWPTGKSWVNILVPELLGGGLYQMVADVWVPAGAPDVYLDPVFHPTQTRTPMTLKDQWVTITQNFMPSSDAGIYLGLVTNTAPTSGQKTWIDNFTVRPVDTRLDAGTYIAEVRTADSFGAWSPWSASATYVQSPPSNTYVKQGGVWVLATSYVKQGGVFVETGPKKIRQGGVWVE